MTTTRTAADSAYTAGYQASLEDLRVMILDGMSLDEVYSWVAGSKWKALA